MIDTVARVRLSPAKLEQLEAYFRDPAELADALGCDLPEGWPVDPTAFLYVANGLQNAPEQACSWMYWAFDSETGALVGDGGFRKKPKGAVELGWEIGDSFRGRGYALSLVRNLCELAFEDPSVTQVDVHTKECDRSSGSVLVRAGFAPVENDLIDPMLQERERAVAWTLWREDMEDL